MYLEHTLQILHVVVLEVKDVAMRQLEALLNAVVNTLVTAIGISITHERQAVG